MLDTDLGLLNNLRLAQSTKDSLMQAVLMTLSSVNKVIVFEGDTDYQVYDEWFKNDEEYLSAEHICAKGKTQILELYKHVKTINHHDIINGCKFFVDHDYDLYAYNDECITTLDCYSVENYLVNEIALINVLKDEFHLDARRKNERDHIIEQFKCDLSVFNKLAKDVCLPLFLSHHINGKAKFYNKITDVISISYGNVKLKDNALQIIPSVEHNYDTHDLENRFNELPFIRSIRGKYHFEFIKKWLSNLREVINSGSLYDLPKITKDPEQMDMRRFASATPPPIKMSHFSC